MGANTYVEQQMSIHLNGPQVVLTLSAEAALRLAGALTSLGGGQDGSWLDEMSHLLRAATAETNTSSGSPETSQALLLRGHWSSEGEPDVPFTGPRPLETISPRLVGVWRTRLGGRSIPAQGDADNDSVAVQSGEVTAAEETPPLASVHAVDQRMSNARAALAARVSGAADGLEDSRGDEQTE